MYEFTNYELYVYLILIISNTVEAESKNKVGQFSLSILCGYYTYRSKC